MSTINKYNRVQKLNNQRMCTSIRDKLHSLE